MVRQRLWPLLSVVVAGLAVSGCTPPTNPVTFSPAGDRLVFPGGAPQRLHVVNADGTGLASLPGTQRATGPRWSPGGEYVAYQTDEGVSLYDLDDRTVLSSIEGAKAPGIWSPAGDELAVFEKSGEHLEACRYRVPELTEISRVRLPVDQVDADQGGRWLKSRNGMAFLAGSGGSNNLYTVEGDTVYRITNTGDVLGFGIQEGGERLIWARGTPDVPGAKVRVWTYDLRRRAGHRLPFAAVFGPEGKPVRGGNPDIWKVSFASDARQMALVVVHRGFPDSVYTCDADGSRMRQLERLPAPKSRREPPTSWLDGAYWAPTGDRVITIKIGNHPAIRVHNLSTGASTKLPLPTPPEK